MNNRLNRELNNTVLLNLLNIKAVGHQAACSLSRCLLLLLLLLLLRENKQRLGVRVCSLGRAVAQAVSRWLPTAAARVRFRPEHVRFVVDKAALGQVISEYFGFPCQLSLHQFLQHHNHSEWHKRPIGGHSAEWTQLDSTPLYTNLEGLFL
jgi:hypothetical protein